MSVEQPVEVLVVGVAEMIRPAQESEAGSEHLWFVCWGPLIRGTALYPPAVPG